MEPPLAESWRSRLLRWRFNWFPAYRGSGGRVTYISPDLHEIHVKVPLNWRTKNYVGTIYGGSMYSAVDPFHMVMLINILGPDYVVWDKAAAIRFRRPGKSTLSARIVIDPDEPDEIRALLETEPKIDRVYEIELTDTEGTVCAIVTNTVHISRRQKAGE